MVVQYQQVDEETSNASTLLVCKITCYIHPIYMHLEFGHGSGRSGSLLMFREGHGRRPLQSCRPVCAPPGSCWKSIPRNLVLPTRLHVVIFWTLLAAKMSIPMFDRMFILSCRLEENNHQLNMAARILNPAASCLISLIAQSRNNRHTRTKGGKGGFDGLGGADLFDSYGGSLITPCVDQTAVLYLRVSDPEPVYLSQARRRVNLLVCFSLDLWESLRARVRTRTPEAGKGCSSSKFSQSGGNNAA
jgi:hypothetical protein